MANQNIMVNNLSIVRNIAYKKIKDMSKDVKEIVQVEDDLLKRIDINMKNAINKIIHDYKVYQQSGVYKIK
jgi:hypothetical protein